MPRYGPLIIVGNHPNTFMDPLILATLFKQQVGFLGNASIFVNSFVNSIFKFFKVIPVYRDKDVKPGEKIDNEKTFRDCFKFLEEKNSIMLFPEGTSIHELKLRKIKTGCARIALGTEIKNDFKLGVRIIPIGLYYSNPSKFQSKIYVNVGEVINVSDFETAFKDNEIDGVQSLTQRIKESLESLTISTTDKEQEDLFLKIKRIYKEHLVNKFSKTNSQEEEFRLTKEIANALQYFKLSLPLQYEQLKTQIERCNQLLDLFNTSSRRVTPLENKAEKVLYTVSGALYLLLGLPLYLYGLIQNYLPFNLPYWIAKIITKEPEYYAPIMMSLGMIIFPAYYTASLYLFGEWTNLATWPHVAYFISLPLSGYFALHYFKFVNAGISFLSIHGIVRPKKELIKELENLRAFIFDALDDARDIYLKRL